tara:strand:+ start:405 stop:608 length:204 start_codon:yes stop_codon:yes gene_type:complete
MHQTIKNTRLHTNQPKETMTNKQIKNNLIQDMKKDIELKKYVKDIEDLNQKQFKILINVFKKVQLNN